MAMAQRIGSPSCARSTRQAGYTPLCMIRPPAVMTVLLEHRADPNIATPQGWTPLMFALQTYEAYARSQARDGYRQVALMLVAAGARLDSRNQNGVDAFYYTKDAALKQELRALARNAS